MWPLERSNDVVSVGRNRVEYWASSTRGLVLRGQHALASTEGLSGPVLADGLGRLFQTIRGESGVPRQSKATIDMVFESAWLPIMLIEVGHSLWSRKPLKALLHHRFSQLYNDRDDPVAAWQLELDHRAGDQHGLGYGISPSIRQAAVDAAAAAGLRLASLQPAFAWGWQRLRQHRRRSVAGAANDGGWWLWIEQDRSLVCHLDNRGRLSSLNAGAAVPEDAAQCRRLIEIEALRQGVPAEEAGGVVAGWHQTPHATRVSGSDRLVFVSAAAERAVPRVGAAARVHAGAGA